MTPDFCLRAAIRPALSLLPAKMDSLPARAMLVAIGLQESKFQYRSQHPTGPARSYWQFEQGGGVVGVLGHPASATHAAAVLEFLSYPSTMRGPLHVWQAMQHNDILAAAFARLLLWTDPGSLPTRHAPEDGWAVYLRTWRPGKPHPETWDAYYALAWDVVTAGLPEFDVAGVQVTGP